MSEAQKCKVFFGGLKEDLEESDLRDYFKEYGTIVDINIVLHKNTGKRRGFAFVEFDDHEPVDRIVVEKFHTIKGRRIEAKRAIPKSEMAARKRVDQHARATAPVSLLDAMMMMRNSAAAPAYLWEALASSAPYGPSGAAAATAAAAAAVAAAHLHPPPPGALYHHGHHLEQPHHPHHHPYSLTGLPGPPHHYHTPAELDHHRHHNNHSCASAPSEPSTSSGWLSAHRSSAASGFSSHQQNGAINSWAADVLAQAVADYNRLPLEAQAAGIGPIRTLGYRGQHSRAHRPYASYRWTY